MNELQNGIAIVGSTTIDDNILADRHYRKLGGVGSYAGLTYRRQGISVFVVSNIARKDVHIKSKLTGCGLEFFSGDSTRTTHFVNDAQGARLFQQLTQIARPIGVKQIQVVLSRAIALQLGPLHPLDIDPSAYAMLKQTKQRIFLDVQGLVRKIVSQHVYPGVSIHLAAALRAAQIIKANEREHQTILDHYQLNLSEIMHRFKIDESVVTLGKDGGFVQTRSGTKFGYEAVPAKIQEDPPGAGDVFFASYIVSRFFNRMEIPDACHLAARNAARQVEGNYIVNNQLALYS